MKNFPFNPVCRKILYVVIPVLFTLSVLAAIPAFAENNPLDSDKGTQKIHISADRLISDSAAMHAEFKGNVRATQGDTVITGDNLKIFYKKSIDNNMASKQESIKKIIVRGNVKINFDNKLAETEEAVYIADTKILVLNGENSKVTSGNSYITGNKITVHRQDGRVIVERGSDKRVEAVIYSGEKGLNLSDQ